MAETLFKPPLWALFMAGVCKEALKDDPVSPKNVHLKEVKRFIL